MIDGAATIRKSIEEECRTVRVGRQNAGVFLGVRNLLRHRLGKSSVRIKDGKPGYGIEDLHLDRVENLRHAILIEYLLQVVAK